MPMRKGNAAFTLIIVLLLISLCVHFYQSQLSDFAQGHRRGAG